MGNDPVNIHRPGVHLQYAFESRGQTGAGIENPLFDLLSALQVHGSIKHAALALGHSYRHTWGEVRRWEQVLGQPLVHWAQGKRAHLTAFALRLVWAERQARTRMTPHLEALRAELRHVLALAMDESIDVVELLASHDMQLPRLQSLAEREGIFLGLRFAASAEALRHLNEGVCALAGFHVPRFHHPSDVFSRALRPLLRPGAHKLIGSHSRVQGLMFQANHAALMPPASVADLAKPLPGGRSWRFVNRQVGSGTRLLMDHLLAQHGVDASALEGYETRIEFTHVAVAGAIAAGAADVGLGVQAAAAEYGLGFLPLIEEDYYLVCLKPALDQPAVQRLRQVLASRAWALMLDELPGYAPHRPGEVMSLTRALPWWQFTRKKRSKRP